MSKYDEERKRMGVQPIGLQTPVDGGNVPQSKYAAERARLSGSVQTYSVPTESDKLYTEQDDAAQMAQASRIASARSAVGQMGNVQSSPLMKNVEHFATSHPEQMSKSSENLSLMDVVDKALSSIFPTKENGRNLPLVGPALRGADVVSNNPISNAIAEYTVPDAPLLDGSGRNAREEFLQKAGREPATGLAKYAGMVAAPFFVPGAQLGTGNQVDDAVKMAMEKVSLMSKVGGIAAEMAGSRAPEIGKLGQSAIRGIANGGLTAAGSEFAQGSADPKQAVKSAIVGAGLGGALGAAGPLVGEGLRGAKEAIEKNTNDWFTKLFGNQGVGAVAGAKTPRRSGTGMQIVDNPLKRDAQGKIDHVKEFGRAVQQDYIDLTTPLKHIGDDVREVALDARRSNNLANTWVHDKAVTPEGVVIGNGLKEIIGNVPRGQADTFEDYLIVRHAKTRVARGERVYEDRLGMNDVKKLEARQADLEARYPHFKDLGEKWDRYNTNLLDTGEAFGLISKAQKEAMRTENPNYASMRRQFSTSEKFAQPFSMRSNSFSGQKAPIKAVSPTGSARKIVSPVRSAIEQTGAWMNAGMRNRVMQSILKRVQDDPEGLRGIVELVDESSQATAKSLKEINDVLARDGVEGLTEFLNNDYAVMFRKSSQVGAKTDNLVTVMVDGNPVKLKVKNPEIFKSLVGLGPEESNFVLDFFGFLSNATKRGATGALAPLFAAKNLTVDVAQALIQSKDPLRHVPDLLHATVSSIANKLPRNTPGLDSIRALAQDFQRSGGEYSAALRGEKPLKKAVGDLRKEPFLSSRGILKGTTIAAKAPFQFLEGVSDVAENINRIAAYKGTLRRLGGAKTPENVRAAMRESQEITTNFSRKGSKSQTIEKFFPYSNAAIQGLRRFGVQLRDNPGKTALMVGGFVIAPKIWEQARFGDDPDYQKLPERTRYRNIIVGKKSDGTFIQIPMPPEYAAIGALASDAMAQLKGQDYVKWRDASDALVNAYTPPFVSGPLQGVTQPNGAKSALEQSGWGLANSTSAGPLVGTLANQSWTGAPIVSQTYAANSPYMQKDERTSRPSEWLAGTQIGKTIGISPMKLDYLVKQYGGDLARLGLPLTSDVGGGTVNNTLLKSFIVDPVFTNNLSRDYYNRIEQVKAAAADVEDGAKPPAWYNDTVKKLATGAARGDATRILRDLTAKKRDIQADRNLSSKAKADQLRSVQEEINNLYLDVAARLDAMGVPK